MELIHNNEYSSEHFYKKVLKIGFPIMLAQLMASLLSVIDSIMVSSLGDNALVAVMVSGNFAFLLIMIEFGVLSGLSIFIAQYWGSKDIKNIHKVFMMASIIGFFVSIVFFVFAFFFPEFVIGLYDNTNDPVNSAILREYGVSYLKVAAFSYFTMTVTAVISALMRNVEKVVYPQVIAVIAVIINTILNYLLINGHYGFPALGVQGAAIATLISTGVGSLLMISYLLHSKLEVFKIHLSTIKEISKEFIARILKKALPVAINETIWGLGMMFYLIAYGFISKESIASVQISNQVMGLFWVINAGISTSCAIMIGNKLGENKLDLAASWGKRFMKLSLAAGVLLGVVLFILSDYIPLLFKDTTPLVRDNASLILKVFSFYIPIKFSNALHIVGTLRAGGDTKYALFAELFPLWAIGVPLAFILSIYSSLPLFVIVALVNVEEIVKFVLVLTRFFTFKWVRNLTVTS